MLSPRQALRFLRERRKLRKDLTIFSQPFEIQVQAGSMRPRKASDTNMDAIRETWTKDEIMGQMYGGNPWLDDLIGAQRDFNKALGRQLYITMMTPEERAWREAVAWLEARAEAKKEWPWPVWRETIPGAYDEDEDW